MTKEEIESLGWVFGKSHLRDNFLDIFKLQYYILSYKYDDHSLNIIYSNPNIWTETEDIRFKGTIKNKSELKTLMKQLNIK